VYNGASIDSVAAYPKRIGYAPVDLLLLLKLDELPEFHNIDSLSCHTFLLTRNLLYGKWRNDLRNGSHQIISGGKMMSEKCNKSKKSP
jgi:hypothetical protein